MKRRCAIILLVVLVLPLTATAQPLEDERVLIRIGEHAFDPSDPETQERFRIAGDGPDRSVGWILQFQRPLSPEQMRRLRGRYGLILQDYVPDNAYLVWLPATDMARLVAEERELYRGHVRYHAELKIPGWIRGIAGTQGSVQLRITPFDAVDPSRLAEEIRTLARQRIDVVEVGDRTPQLIVEIPLREIGNLGQIEGIRRIEDLPFRSEDRIDFDERPGAPDRTADAMRYRENRLAEDVVVGRPAAGQRRLGSTSAAESASVDSARVSGDELPRHWTEVLGGIGFGRDSNVLLVGEGSSFSGEKHDTHFLGYAGVDYRRTKFDRGRKTWELGVNGQAAWIDQQEIDNASLFDWNVGAYVDWEVRPPRNGAPPWRPTYRTGLLVRHAEVRLDHDALVEIDQAVVSGSIAYRQRGECELSRLSLFVSFEDVDDRLSESDPALNRSGSVTSAGVRRSFGPKDDRLHNRWVCQGGGTFRKLFLENYWTLHSEYVRSWVHTDGTEFGHDADTLRVEGHWPLWRRERAALIYRSKLNLDVDLSHERLDFSRNSIFSGGRREDDVTVVDIGLIFPLILQSEYYRIVPQKYLDLSVRVGGQYTDNRSNIDLFDYDRTVYGVNLHVVWGHQNVEFVRKMDPVDPGSTPGDDVGSGPSRPKPDGG